MKTSLLFLILVVMVACVNNSPTIIHVNNGCSYYSDAESTEEDYYVFNSSQEAERIVAEIVDAISLPKNFTVKASDVKNAMATTEGGIRYILYSTTFLEQFKAHSKTRWAAYSVLAHEIGHHLSGHDFGETDPGKLKRMELEADVFSGGVLRLLGATLSQAQAGIRTFDLAGETSTHPPKRAREEAIANGWKKQDERLRGTVEAKPMPRRESEKDLTFRETSCEFCPEMVFIKGNMYSMGCPEIAGNDCQYWEKPSHRVTVPDFYLGKYEVTQIQWRSVMGSNPSQFQNCDDCPVENITFDDVRKFIQKLNEKTGKYFRLPTEAEWEYAARGGAFSRGYMYSGGNNLDEVAWYNGNSGGASHPVGKKLPNELGIYDLTGNAEEWCADNFNDDYTKLPTDGSAWNPTSWWRQGVHVTRSGTWYSSDAQCRVYRRNFQPDNGKGPALGLRLAQGN